MALTAPSTRGRAAPLTVTGRLTWPHAHVTTGAVHVVKTDLAHGSGYSLGTVPVAADGGFAFHDTPQVGGANTYAFSYDGGTSYLPVTASAKVQVSRATPSVSLTTDAKSYHSGATVKVTAHLGTTYNSRLVTLYDQPAGKPRTQLKSGFPWFPAGSGEVPKAIVNPPTSADGSGRPGCDRGLLHWRHRRHQVGGLRRRLPGRICRISATIAPG
ncbi:hypothetical protein OG585_19380 [Streptomyces sp. NBC_01340]|uniref:hypothetical protein n=1 Tax=unclassified Streptomyces TaxID=2593676 RepID=UPI002259E32C|nr:MULTISPECIES: hypothetical protein [unclassified Streptomyces]MCX4454810.1 hypothetical protein [Streptomyces sp. NBC_01719]MCX4494170.1 hypothetical protein [Streptomyces sp. NBC_01728]MCX4591322.1 hypothetical protein [Streptomyces sp. NBC_01549]WSI39231.1 hypothetical protein OG585_19380 [Streptomyces sp. NBC_01340]